MEDNTDGKSEADTDEAEAEPLDRNLAEVVVEACTEAGDLRAAKDVEVEAFTDVLGLTEKEVEVDASLRVAPMSRMPLT